MKNILLWLWQFPQNIVGAILAAFKKGHALIVTNDGDTVNVYLLLIGIPSACGNIYDRFFHKKWTSYRRNEWYYKQPWEKWADRLGGV